MKSYDARGDLFGDSTCERRRVFFSTWSKEVSFALAKVAKGMKLISSPFTFCTSSDGPTS